MKSHTRTVLNTTLTGASSYTSGPLDVGDLYELTLDFNVTAVTYTSGSLSMSISRIGADGNLYALGSADLRSVGPCSVEYGAGIVSDKTFGDRVQLDLVANGGNSVTTTIAILGKG